MELPTKYDFEQGAILLVNKPLGWTSFDVVNKLRNLVKTKVGHAGTLDPLATGLLIICTGKFTKKISGLQVLNKEYTGTMVLGGETASYDKEYPVETKHSLDGLDEKQIVEATGKFIGNILQTPPSFSAIKVNGQPLYKLARKGIAPAVPPREVIINKFEIQEIKLPKVSFRVECSKGTYIRSLVHDFGKALHNGAYLDELCRTAVGNYQLKDAWELGDLIKFIQDQN